MEKNVRAVMFDIGGVLELTPETGWRARWEARLGLEGGGLDRRLAEVWRAGAVGAIGEEEVHRRVGAALGLGAEETERLMEDVWEEYLGSGNTPLIELFAGLRPRYRTGIISNSFVGARRREQERYGFEDLCDVIVYSHEVGMNKPDRRIYAIACERIGAEPGGIVFVDDVEENVVAARELGMTGVLFEGNATAIPALRRLLEL